MRVIAGSARRLLLKTVDGMETRPTTDRIKETLFNMLQNDLYGARFLDLFAGSGAIGIEALSRGAKEAVFVDKGDGQISCIRENLKTTHLEEKARVMSADVTEAVRRLDRDGKSFDFIFMDPPYRKIPVFPNNIQLRIPPMRFLQSTHDQINRPVLHFPWMPRS